MYQIYIPPPLSASLSYDSDAFSTDLAAGELGPKLTVGGYAVGGGCPKVEFPSSNGRDCGRACRARTVEWISWFPGLHETGSV